MDNNQQNPIASDNSNAQNVSSQPPSQSKPASPSAEQILVENQSEKSGRTKYIAVFVVALIVIVAMVSFASFFDGMFKSAPAAVPEVPIPSDEVTYEETTLAPTEKVMVMDKSEELVYTNSEYGFKITLPDSWEGYTVKTNGQNEPITISFNVPTQIPTTSENRLEVSPLNIYVFTANKWDTLGKKPLLLAQNDQYVFATDPIIPPPDDCVQLDEYQCASRKEGQETVKTFRLIEVQ